MIIPLLIVSAWSTAITVISKNVYELKVNNVLLTVLGFVVGLALSFRSSTAYERYIEGAKYWANLMLACRSLARMIWMHTNERHENPTLGKADLLAKITVINLINGFAVALKHRLRFEAAPDYADLAPYIECLDIMVSNGDDFSSLHPPDKRNPFKRTGEFLGVSFAESNPRKYMKRATFNLGNIPHEILGYLQSYLDHILLNGTLSNGPVQSNILAQLSTMADVATSTERIVNHPLPLAYTISIAQITWAYVMVLPFQLYLPLGWLTIPGTIFAAYIILGLGAIGSEIENPFGNDVNDLPLETYCRELQCDLDVLTSIARAERSWNFEQGAQEPAETWLQQDRNKPLFPLSNSGWHEWHGRPLEQVREALWHKASNGIRLRKRAEDQHQLDEKQAVATAARKHSDTTTEGTRAMGMDSV